MNIGGGILLTSAAIFAAVPAHADCYPEHTQAALDAANRASDWRDVQKLFTRDGMCDDGAVAEAFSGSVARVLTEHWESIPTLDHLVAANPKFKRFVLRHVDSLMSPDQARAIEDNARHHCPRDSSALCAAIVKQISERTR